MDRFLLGIDAGGSRCRALLADWSGHLIGQGHSEGIGKDDAYGSGRSAVSVISAASEALKDFSGDRIYCVSSFGVYDFEKIIGKIIPCETSFEHAGEYEAALTLSENNFGYVALAGTGAGCMAFRPNHKEKILDGLGPNAGDFGSGYWIGKRAIEAAIRAKWAPKYATLLEEPINLLYLGTKENHFGSDFVSVFLKNQDRSFAAKAAKIANDCAEKGDKIALSILEEAGAQLAETLYCLVKYAAPWHEPLPVICTGSVINSKFVGAAFDRKCGENLPEYKVIHEIRPQAKGQLLCLAKRHMNQEEYKIFSENLKKEKEIFL